MHSPIFSYPLVIKEQHLDTFGHVNNATYLTLFEEARWEFITRNGFGLEKIVAESLGPTILEITLQFIKEMRLRQEVVIESQMLSYESKVGRLKQNILCQGQIHCQAEFIIGLFDLKARRLIAPTPAWLAALGMT